MDNAKIIFTITLFYCIGCTSIEGTKVKVEQSSIKLSPLLDSIAHAYYDNFDLPSDTIRFLQILDSNTDSTRMILHCFGKDAFLMDNYHVLGSLKTDFGTLHYGISKTPLIISDSLMIERKSAIREFCQWLITDFSDSIKINHCFQMRELKPSETWRFEEE